MSETANTLIKAALRSIGAIATGETPTDAEMQDGLEALQFMFRSWSAKNIRLYYTEQDTVSLSGTETYTIGDGGTINTVRPSSIRGARISNGIVKIIDEAMYRHQRASQSVGTVEYLWYNPEYPLGILNFWPLDSETVYLDSLKELTDPTDLTSSVAFPTEYDDAIKWNLAVRLAPEYGKEASPTIVALAISTLSALETRNFAEQMNSSRLEIIRITNKYNIEAG